MIEKKYDYTTSDSKTIEKLINDDYAMINHMILPQGDSLPEHYSDSNIYMIIVRGVMSIRLEDQETHRYEKCDILNIPYHTLMNVTNNNSDILEFFVVKSPNPKNYVGK